MYEGVVTYPFIIYIVIDHGAANIESMMNEALEDIPTLVSNVQEKLKCELY